jgi:hypothetical protein
VASYRGALEKSTGNSSIVRPSWTTVMNWSFTASSTALIDPYRSAGLP